MVNTIVLPLPFSIVATLCVPSHSQHCSNAAWQFGTTTDGLNMSLCARHRFALS